MSANVKLEGMEQLMERVMKLATPAKVRNTLKLAMGKALVPTRDRIAALAPDSGIARQGKTKDNVIIVNPPPRMGAQMRVAVNTPVAHLLEFGTVKMRAQPFIRPGFDQTKDQILKIYAEDLAKRLLKEGV